MAAAWWPGGEGTPGPTCRAAEADKAWAVGKAWAAGKPWAAGMAEEADRAAGDMIETVGTAAAAGMAAGKV